MSKRNYLKFTLKDLNVRELITVITENQSLFNYATVITHEKGVGKEILNLQFRNCLIMKSEIINTYVKQIEDFIFNNRVEICESLGLTNFRWGKKESSCTAYGDGAYFNKHRDVINDGRPGRRLTWVYYFHQEPKQYKGGGISFFPKNSPKETFEPENGTLIVFNSNMFHEVEIVTLEKNNFDNRRFALTGFISKKSNYYHNIKYQTKIKLRRTIGEENYNKVKTSLNKLFFR